MTRPDLLACSQPWLAARVEELEAERDALAAKLKDMHRRCQLAEGAVLRKMSAEQAAGAPIAKRLALAAHAAAESKLDRVRLALAKVPDVRGEVLDHIRRIVGEKIIVESNPA